MMRIYLDDIRDPPKGRSELQYDAICRTAKAALALIDTGEVTYISFDHDLGGTLTGYDVAKRIEELTVIRPAFVPPRYDVHSANPAGADNIKAAMRSAHKHKNKT